MSSAARTATRNPDSTLYVGELTAAVDEELLWELFVQAAPVTDVHMPRDKLTGTHAGYGFVEFPSVADAEYAMRVMNMTSLYGQPIRLNKSSRRAADAESESALAQAKLFVGNLDPQVDEKLLYDVFSAFGFCVSPPKLVRDADNPSESRGFAFLTFDTFEAADAAIAGLNGQFLSGRPINVSYALKKDSQERHGSEAERALAKRAKDVLGAERQAQGAAARAAPAVPPSGGAGPPGFPGRAPLPGPGGPAPSRFQPPVLPGGMPPMGMMPPNNRPPPPGMGPPPMMPGRGPPPMHGVMMPGRPPMPPGFMGPGRGPPPGQGGPPMMIPGRGPPLPPGMGHPMPGGPPQHFGGVHVMGPPRGNP